MSHSAEIEVQLTVVFGNLEGWSKKGYPVDIFKNCSSPTDEYAAMIKYDLEETEVEIESLLDISELKVTAVRWQS